jgi:hypothetical protein
MNTTHHPSVATIGSFYQPQKDFLQLVFLSAKYGGAACRWFGEPEQQFDGGGFVGAIRSQETEDRIGPDL